MLSRIAESLFWIGRYVERADDTARLLDAHIQRLVEDPWIDEEAACRSLLAVMGSAAPAGPVDRTVVMEQLAYDPVDPTAIAGSLTAARENARGARETIASEIWVCLNTTWRRLPAERSRAGRAGTHAYLSWVRERGSVFAGLVDGAMSRDEGWDFLILGRSLERVDMTARLISTRELTGGAAPDWTSLLRSCHAYETFLRTYRGASEDRLAAEFLLLDRLFPRSVFAALATAETSLARLAPSSGRAGPADEARRLLGRARTTLEFRGVDELLLDLPAQMTELQRTCSAVSDAVSARFFPRAAAFEWAHEEIR